MSGVAQLVVGRAGSAQLPTPLIGGAGAGGLQARGLRRVAQRQEHQRDDQHHPQRRQEPSFGRSARACRPARRSSPESAAPMVSVRLGMSRSSRAARVFSQRAAATRPRPARGLAASRRRSTAVAEAEAAPRSRKRRRCGRRHRVPPVARPTGTVVGGPHGIVMPGAISRRRLDDRLRRWRRPGRPAAEAGPGGGTRIAADLLGAWGTSRCRCRPGRRPSWPSRCPTAGPTRTPARPTCSPAVWCRRVVPTQTAVDSDGV